MTNTNKLPVTKPIFIVGTGRCGSTALHRVLGAHPQMMWLSGFAEKFPLAPGVEPVGRHGGGNPLVRRLVGEQRIKPGENYGFWYAHAYGFAEPGRDLVASDVTPRVRRQLHGAFERMLTTRRAPAPHQADRLVAHRVPERGVPGRQVHTHRPGRPGGRQLVPPHQRVAVARMVRSP